MGVYNRQLPYFVKPRKALGQNFLKNKGVVEKIIKAGNIKKTDIIVEVGPGFGILTKELAKHAEKIIAIEIDKGIFERLKGQAALGGLPRTELIFGDALKFTPPKTKYKLIANIPYSITSPLINHFLKNQFMNRGNPPTECVLMVQHEVAKKICASPPDMNVLALNIQTFSRPVYLFKVSRNSFYPKPNVDSAVIKIEIHKKLIVKCDLNLYFKLISAAFSQKRKILKNSLQKILGENTEEILKKAGINPQRRPETLTIAEWECLTLT